MNRKRLLYLIFVVFLGAAFTVVLHRSRLADMADSFEVESLVFEISRIEVAVDREVLKFAAAYANDVGEIEELFNAEEGILGRLRVVVNEIPLGDSGDLTRRIDRIQNNLVERRGRISLFREAIQDYSGAQLEQDARLAADLRTRTSPLWREVLALSNDRVLDEFLAEWMKYVTQAELTGMQYRKVLFVSSVMVLVVVCVAVLRLRKSVISMGMANAILQEKLSARESELQRAGATLSDSKEANQKSLQTRSLLLANMSHEIRTPLNGIMGMSQLLLTQSLDKQQKEDLEVIAECSHALLGVVCDILDLSKIEAGILTLTPKDFSLRALIGGVCRILAPHGNAREVSVLHSVDNDVVDALVGDEIRIRQVLLNLVANAIKFAPSGGQVSVEVARVEERLETVLVRFKVQDMGVEIPGEKRKFAPSPGNGGALSERMGGAGLGLAIAEGLVRLMGGGEIELNSHKDVGHCSSFTLLLQKGDVKKIVEIPEKSGPSAHEPLITGLKILIVDDSDVSRRVLSLMLEQAGHLVSQTSSGKEGLEILSQSKLDLVMLDLEMPEMDGFSLARAIRRSGAPWGTIPIIAVSSHDLRSDHDACESAGIDGFIAKPFLRAQVLVEIGEIISAKQKIAKK